MIVTNNAIMDGETKHDVREMMMNKKRRRLSLPIKNEGHFRLKFRHNFFLQQSFIYLSSIFAHPVVVACQMR
jgi:hypothetical protein